MPSTEAIEIRRTLVKDQLDPTPLAERRKAWDEHAQCFPIPADISISEDQVGGLSSLWYRNPDDREDTVVLYMHGGGLTEGSAYTSQPITAQLTHQARLPVLSVNYRLAPESPYPAALEDMQSVYRDLLARHRDPKRIAFGADSSGCNLALSLLLAIRNLGLPMPAAAFFISPSVDLTFSGKSMRSRAAVDPVVSPDVLADCARLYAQGVNLESPAVSPLFDKLSNLPPLLLQVGDHEILLSDAIRLHDRVQSESGVSKLSVWPEMWHVWHVHAEMPESKEAIEEIGAFLSDSFGF